MSLATTTVGASAEPATDGRPAPSRRTVVLLAAGVLAGPLFLATTLVQFAAKADVDPRIHPLSMLSLGAAGWIQIANFIVAGLLILASAAGLRRMLHGSPAGTWGPILIAVYGAALLMGGVLVVDPGHGYPAGAPAGPPEELSWHGMLHILANPLMGLALVVAALVFGYRFRRTDRRGWAAVSHGTAVAYLGLTVVGMVIPDYRVMLAGGALGWLWASATTGQILAARPRRPVSPAAGRAR
ncbi:DUF998 domain-containing protein [Plantactinospora sp. BC1]|uniref:DUF998 domain-containing protein n=1 Tax=Plantactinospora sp. BC1 TaxID=2108470 RepID=UPI000D163E7C|nr:DUF998 domain-containing protein [Plantactinospora sp. BC1]AVT32382.1 DUF998 domain-containing protein [Plantactinospora sp. BC1]